MSPIVGRCTQSQYSAISKLLSQFDGDAMTEDERGAGFLQGRFSEAAVRWFGETLAVIVAVDGADVVAALCASDLRREPLPAPLAPLKAHLSEWRLKGEALDPQHTLAYGPVAIDRRYRGQGLLKALYGALLAEAPSDFRSGVAFVASDNPRSLKVHCEGLGMEQLGIYQDRGQTMIAIGFTIP
jgi:GNAT superfamily N-acetyltransferase